MTPRLDLIGIATSDMSRSLDFYRLLGLTFDDGAEDAPHVEVTLDGGLRLAWDTVATIQSFDPAWSTPSGGARVALAFDCDTPDGVDATYDRLVAAGAHGHLSPWDAVWGQRYAIVHDPDGNTIDIFAEAGSPS